MLPQNKLSSEGVSGEFLLPVRKYTNKSTSFGGIDFDNVTQGIASYIWEGVTDGKKITVSNGVNTHDVVTETVDEIVFFDFAFTLNMNIVVSWETISGKKYFRFFDTATNQYETVNVTGISNLCCSLDESRLVFSQDSDVILAYQRDGDKALCIRMQRDRYTIEYELSANTQYYLKQIGMMSNNRFGFMFSDSEDYAF